MFNSGTMALPKQSLLVELGQCFFGGSATSRCDYMPEGIAAAAGGSLTRGSVEPGGHASPE